MKQQKHELKAADPKLAIAEQKLEAVFQELVCINHLSKNPGHSTKLTTTALENWLTAEILHKILDKL